jgi:hypothetical protein
MAAAFLRLLAIAAFVLMPFGMNGATAGTGPTPADHSAMAMGTGHCDEQPNKDKVPAAKMDCTAMCSALPAADTWVPLSVLKPSAPRTLAIAAPFSGIEPEIATPPPRHS